MTPTPEAAFGAGLQDHLDGARDLDGDGRADRVGSVVHGESEYFVVQLHTAAGWRTQCLGSDNSSDRHDIGFTTVLAGAATYLVVDDAVDWNNGPADTDVHISYDVYRVRSDGAIMPVTGFTLSARFEDHPTLVGAADESVTVSVGAPALSQRLRWDPAHFRLVP